MAARLVKVMHVRLNLGDGAMKGPHPFAALNRDTGTPRVPRDEKAGAEPPAPVPPRAKGPDDSSVVVLRKDMMVDEDRGREQPVQTDAAPNASPAKPRKRRSDADESLSIGTIAVTLAAVIVAAFGFTALLPSLLTRDAVESAATVVATPPPVQPQIERFAAQPVPDPAAPPAQPPTPVLPAPASNDAKSVATPPPALRTTSVPPARQAQVAVPSEGKGPATGRIRLTAAEQAAVTRGLAAMKNTIAAPRPAATLSTLTIEEKAAVERGLRELEKTAGQAKP